MPLLPNITQFVSLCAQKGIKKVIICPGSRSAALALAFDNISQFETHVVSDERSAAFIALGMSLVAGDPIAIVCTSGSAGINLFPAIAEAYFSEVPLFIITADRPTEWINQNDGQTIFQRNLYGSHVKSYHEFNANLDKDFYVNRITNESINTMLEAPKGPVHLNISLDEPFYPDKDESYQIDNSVKIVDAIKIKKRIKGGEWQKLVESLLKFDKILILVGQQTNRKLIKIVNKLSAELNIKVIADVFSNAGEEAVYGSDFIMNEELKPDLLISVGKSVISKNLKLILRGCSIEEHWHISEEEGLIDPFLSITKSIKMNPIVFLKKLFEDLDFLNSKNRFDSDSLFDYSEKWRLAFENFQIAKHKVLDSISWSDLKATKLVLSQIKSGSILHLGNSMAVRYANIIDLNREIKVFCNRGTNGIEGSLSTAVGHCQVTEKPVYCLIGDVSFQYDKNAFWNDLLKDNLKIILLNNQGGNIFRMISGPKNQANYKKVFETNQTQNAELIAKEYKINYFSISNENQIEVIQNFMDSKGSAILECFTNPEENEIAFKQVMELKKN